MIKLLSYLISIAILIFVSIHSGPTTNHNLLPTNQKEDGHDEQSLALVFRTYDFGYYRMQFFRDPGDRHQKYR